MESGVVNKQETEAIFRKLFKGGDKLRRMPKGRRDTEVFLALAASVLDPRAVYSERELDEQLEEWMVGFTNTSRLDHVTVRRFLVDYRFVIRDRPGSVYQTNQAVINATLEPEARSVLPHQLFDEAVIQRAQRRKRAASTQA